MQQMISGRPQPRAYCNAQLEPITISPRELGVPAIGHMGYFRPQCETLWRQTLDWLVVSE
jgi:predicted alpha/beta hydrolase